MTDNNPESKLPRRKQIVASAVIAVVVLLYVFNMAYFSIKPDFFPVTGGTEAPRGELFADTAAKLLENELNGPGGWIPNDIPPSPTWLLDNRPNFQMGILEAIRYTARVSRDNLSRQRTTDKIDVDCDQAFTRFSNDPHKWMLPRAEGKYKDGVRSLRDYAARLESNEASFYPRSDNLIQLLEQYVSLLGGVNTRLLNASRRGGTASDGPGASGVQRVPWTKIDDNFYYAQGVGYALCHLFKAIRIEFVVVLKDKHADIIVNEIITSLEEAYFEPFVVTNGSKGGVFANHSNNLRVFLDDARQKTNSLVRMLDQG